ncbi:aldehyde dehydrogenase family protein [Actinokineospora bangkokensis]|uniref:Aldehyde dehydrogenase n=1 Tax=Actinokineospora bangkokensis TaxID=1193682 RepID=A0A1Q9LLN0_9PSEU|nr:aldehyde dehydrogenase family protein [Actinokineospora bangkokensis]OLR92947.1 aldehyde dehydrogenase [Actinokineospora bangkokensis]
MAVTDTRDDLNDELSEDLSDGLRVDPPFATADAAQTGAAVRRARRAQAGWAATDPAERGQLLHRLADALERRAPELARCNHADTHRPLGEAEASVRAGIGTLRQYAELGPVHRGRALQGTREAADLMVHEPRGVVVALTPWNDPVPTACGLIGAALVTGNAVVHKPSERAERTGALLGALAEQVLPEDVLQTLFGAQETGAALAADPGVDVVAHVGSTAAGRSIAAATAATGAKALLENGGNDAIIIDADVDPVWAAEQTALGAFANAGQICTSVERVIVHADLAPEFLPALVAEAERWAVEPRDGQRALCPLVDERARAAVHQRVREAVSAGATAAAGGWVPDSDLPWYPATVLTGCTPTMPVVAEEVFGPVAPVLVAPDFGSALGLARADRHGLAATVLTGSMAHAQLAWRSLPVGTVKVNAVFGGAPGGAAQPRGASGTGFGYGPELLDELTTTKVVHLRAPGRSGT